jgi:serine/threonine protein kinase
MNVPVVGDQIDRYELEGELGRGAMGVVFLARDRALKRQVALKILAPQLLEDKTARTRFQREIEHSVAIEHPHVVPVYDAGYDGERFFIAMRYVRGCDLFEIVSDEGPLPEARALRLLGQIASALAKVHETGVVHRDVKPQNVLIWSPDTVDEHSFLTDFGIARALDDVLRITRTGALGTPGYMAPELLEGAVPTAACDQYSLACLAFELLTGDLPFGDGKTEDGTPRDLHSSPLPMAFYSTKISKNVRETIERALSPDPAERFPDVRAFVTTDAALTEAFEQAAAISETLKHTRTDSEVVSGLFTEHGLTDARIAEIADLEKSQVVQLRRQAARRLLVGE